MSNLPRELPAFIWRFICRQWKWFLVIQIFCFGWSLDHTLWPYLFSLLIDAITNMSDRAQMWSTLTPLLWAWAGVWLMNEVFFRMAGIGMSKAIPQLEAEVRMSLYGYVQHHSYSYFTENMAGNLSTKIEDMTAGVSSIVQLLMFLFFPVVLAILIMTGFFWAVQPPFALLMGGWICVHAAICFYFSKKCSVYADQHAEARSTLVGKIVDSFTNHINLRLFSRYEQELKYLGTYQEKEQKTQSKALFYVEKMKFALGVASILGPGLLNTWYMLYAWQNEWITTGEVVLIFNTTWNITMMVWIAGLELPKLFKEIGICQQALRLIRQAHDIVDEDNAVPLKVSKGTIHFDHVFFNYSENQRIFEDKNIAIQGGEKVGLVGFSGSGKTTFANLILRHFDINEGKILIDGFDIAKVTQSSLRQQIALIPQDPSLFHRTILENLRFGAPHATETEIMEASKKAHCHEFIMKFPQGYHTIVGERGAKLSGGQRQRIAIARAILKNAPILILDEATSALDSVTERYIQDSLHDLMKNRTTIVIAHRLSTLAGMDRILVFKEGKIVEEGTHQSLLKVGGHYADLWEMQAGGFLPDELE